ncbi:ATP-binding protein [Gordonia aichiensis]|uniref:ATP-binding protein n=1 Tax=Gordonia aichiensis TaxID=36820 RepID=UPI003264C0C7
MGILIILLVVILLPTGGAAAYLKIAKKGVFAEDPSSPNSRAKDLKVKEVSDNRRLGYRYCEEFPFWFIKDGGVWTGVKMASTTDEFDTEAEQESTIARTTEARQALLNYFTNKDPKREVRVQCHELVRNRPPDTAEWQSSYHQSQWDPSSLFTELIDEQVQPHIADAAPERAHYLLIRLGDQTAPRRIDPLAAIVDADDELSDEVFSTAELRKYRQLAQEVIQRMAEYSAPMSRAELAWLIRKPLSGTFPVDLDRDYSRTRFARNSWFDQIADFDGFNLKSQAAVQVNDPNPTSEDEPASSYTAVLTVSTSEITIPFDYWNAWARTLSGLPNPPEISWRYAMVSEALFRKQILKATNNIADEVKDRTKDGSEAALIDTKFGELAGVSEMVRQSMETRSTAGLIGQLRISITAPTLELLDIAEQDVREAMKNFCKLERRKNIQYLLVEEQLPGDCSAANVGRLVMNTDAGGIDVGTRYTDLDILSMARMDSSPTVGDDQTITAHGDIRGWFGHVIGYASENGSIVHFDPFVQMARDSGAGTAIIGASGHGKSTLALTLFFWASESGAQTVVIDPKNDFEAFVYYLSFGSQVLADGFREDARRGVLGTPHSRFQPINRDFWADTKIVSLTYGDNGSMDPWLLTGDFEDGMQLARRQVEHLFADYDPQSGARVLIDLAFAKIRENYEAARVTDPDPELPRLGDLITGIAEQAEYYQEVFKASDEDRVAQMQAQQQIGQIKVVQNRLESARTSDNSRLLFGSDNPDTDAALRGFNHRRTVITMIGFKLPTDPEKIKTDSGARNASAVMFTVLWQVERLFSGAGDTISPNKKTKGLRPRLLIVDEGYMITAMEAGAEMLNVALRQGRSRNFGVIFISQQALDIGKIENADRGDDADPDQNQFSTIFVFKQKGDKEAKDALRLLRSGARMSSVEEDALAEQLRLPPGYCVMKDCDGRVGTVAVDQMFKELFAASQTNAVERPKYQSVNPPSDPRDWTLLTEIRDSTRRTIVRDRLNEATAEVVQFEFPEFASSSI